MQTKRRTAAEIIAFHLGWDMAEVSDCRYQSTVYTAPAIYTLDNDYYAAPSDNRPPKKMEGKWQEIGEHYGRKVFFLPMNSRTK